MRRVNPRAGEAVKRYCPECEGIALHDDDCTGLPRGVRGSPVDDARAMDAIRSARAAGHREGLLEAAKVVERNASTWVISDDGARNLAAEIRALVKP